MEYSDIFQLEFGPVVGVDEVWMAGLEDGILGENLGGHGGGENFAARS